MTLRAAVASVGSYLPGSPISTEDINRRIFEQTKFRVTDGLIERLTGVRSRHFRGENEQSSDLAVEAAKQAIERAGVAASDVDLVVFAACTQDVTEPATANIVQHKLGTKKAQAVDVKNACNSFLNGLDLADSHIRSGKSRCAVVTTGETLSLGIDWRVNSVDDLKSRIGSLTLGDAGAAAVLTALPESEGRGILPSNFSSYGDRWRMATVLGGGSMHHFDPEYAYFRCESQGVRESAYELIPDIVANVLKDIGWEPTDVDVACGHQVTEEMVYGLQERCGVPPGREIITVTECGNTAAASIPLCLARAYEQDKLKPGTKVILIGGAAGFSVGVIPLIW